MNLRSVFQKYSSSIQDCTKEQYPSSLFGQPHSIKFILLSTGYCFVSLEFFCISDSMLKILHIISGIRLISLVGLQIVVFAFGLQFLYILNNWFGWTQETTLSCKEDWLTEVEGNELRLDARVILEGEIAWWLLVLLGVYIIIIFEMKQ